MRSMIDFVVSNTRATLAMVVCLAFLLAGEASAAPPAKPNIVFLLADDLGYGDLACCGHPYARTPNLDRLAKEGTRFEQFYVTGVTCCPSRTGFMTSKFPATFRGYPANAGFGAQITVTELLHQQGYRTGHFGKWHIGPDEKPGTYGIDTTPGSSSATPPTVYTPVRAPYCPLIRAARVGVQFWQ